MMIRINLLPVRQVKKREMGRQVLVLFGAVLILALIVNYIWYSSRAGARDDASAKLEATRAQIALLEKEIGEVNNINKRKAEVQKKLAVLDGLRRSRSGPVKMLDALATAMPKKVWLKEFDEKSMKVRIVGSALSHDDVAEFMRGISNIVWTPKGMGRLVEQKRDAKTSRVELIGTEGAIEDFPVPEVAAFFTAVDLKRAEQKEGSKELGVLGKIVDFEITMGANYAI